MKPSLYVLILVAFWLPGCASQQTNHGTAAEWFEGSVDQAFDLAEKRKVSVFLYFGAKWCPPCNQLKAVVFSKDRFRELMQLVVPVYLDGDTKNAQIWAEKLAVQGYPTMLVLDPMQQEKMRISAFVNLKEFEQALTGAIVNKKAFKQVLASAAQGKASDEQWRLLAYFNWNSAKGINLHSSKTLTLRKKIADKVPDRLKKEKSLLSAALLMAVTRPDVKKNLNIVKRVQRSAAKYVAAMLADIDTILANRGTILYSTADIINFAYPKPGKKKTALESRWLLAAKLIGNDKTVSTESKLWSVFPELQLYKANHPKQKVPEKLASKVKSKVEQADDDSSSAFERIAIVPGAAYLLREAGAFEEAKVLLKKELKKSATPWYFQAALARLADQQKDSKQALHWSDLARRSAKGRATKLQWTVLDLQMTAKYDKAKESKRMVRVTKSLFDHAFVLEGGFSGRNYKYLKKAKDLVVKKSKQDKKFKQLLKSYSKRCKTLEGLEKIRCTNYFRSVG